MKGDIAYDKKKAWAEDLYKQLDKTIPQIAEKVGADQVIVRSWIQEGSWDTVKRSLRISKTMQLERLHSAIDQVYEEAKKDNNREITVKEIDTIIKYTAAIKNLEAETGVSYIVQVAEQFTTWLLHRDAVLARTVTEQFEIFITEHDVTRPKPLR